MALGPQQIPPQGAKALIAGLLNGRRSGPEVSAVLDEAELNLPSIEFLNEGSDTAVGLQCVTEDSKGSLSTHIVGDLAPGATARLRADVAREPFRLVWRCEDSKGRVRASSYDGRSKRLRGDNAATAESAFLAMYP
jgi:hypothetical protein